MVENIAKFFIKSCIKYKFYSVIALFIALLIRVRYEPGKDKLLILSKNKKNAKTIFALDSDRYRGDLDSLSVSNKLNIIHIKQSLFSLLFRCFWEKENSHSLSKNDRAINIEDLVAVDKDSFIFNKNVDYVNFCSNVLRKLYSIIKVDLITNISNRYIEDYHWTLASEGLNVHYVMLYRECLFNRPKIYDLVVKRHSSFGRFHGSRIIVHNNKCKQSFVDSDYCEKQKIFVCGALRMDPFIREIESKSELNKNANKKSFVLFYFPFNIRDFGLWNIYPVFKNRKKLFRDLHFAILDLAVEHKDIEFVIKPKGKMMKEKSWDFYKSILDEYPLNVSKIRNYRVDCKVDAQKIIFESDVVCALQSSTVLESAIANKRVILPLFYNYIKSENFVEFGWKNYLNLFDVATNKEEFKSLVYDAFYAANSSGGLHNKRINLFKKYFGFYDDNALERYLDVFVNTIEEKNQ